MGLCKSYPPNPWTILIIKEGRIIFYFFSRHDFGSLGYNFGSSKLIDKIFTRWGLSEVHEVKESY